MSVRHFLTLLDFDGEELERLLARATELRHAVRAGNCPRTLDGKILGMVFEKSSTRTRVSFEAGVQRLGGHAIFLSPRDTQLGRGEPIEDTARVLSRMVDAIMVRTHEHERIERIAEYASVPVINGLTDRYHPCQLLADLQTLVEARGPIRGRRVAWVGDGNNMCHSWINAAARLGFELHIATPPGFEPDDAVVAGVDAALEIGTDPRVAVAGCDLVVTDVWASMGQEAEAAERKAAFAGFCIDAEMMSHAAPDALFMHCLPAHRGEEVTAEVIDGPASVVWDEAENRMHAQNALLEFLIR